MDKSKIIFSTLIISLFSVVLFATNDNVALVYANNHTNQTNWCIDSDGGWNLPVRGTASNNTANFTDACVSTRTLKEYWCSGQSTIRSTNQDCRQAGYYGCSLGRCYGTAPGNQTNQSGGGNSPLFLKYPTAPRGQLFRRPSHQGGSFTDAYCTMAANPPYGTGPFTSNISAIFYNLPVGQNIINIKCSQNDQYGINYTVYIYSYPGYFPISRLCNYPQVYSPTYFYPRASDRQPNGTIASCQTTVLDNPQQPQYNCTDSDGGRNYPVRGVTSNGTITLQDLCAGGQTAVLTEYYCGGYQNRNVLSEQVSCRNIGFLRCHLGRCVNTTTTGTNSPFFMKIATQEQGLKSRFFLWKIFDIFKGKSTGDAVRRTSSDDSIFGWLILGVILVSGLMYFNNRNNRANNSPNNDKSSKRR